MAAPMPLADFVQGQMYQWTKTWQQQAMHERAERLNTLELIKACKSGEVDLAQVKVNDDGFEVMPPKPVVEQGKPSGRRRK